MAETLDSDTVRSWTTRIPWDTYIGVGRAKSSGEAVFVDSADAKAIRRFALESPTAMTELLATGDEDARRYPQALLKVLMNITDVRMLQYALTMLGDFLSVETAARAKYLTRPGAPSADRRLFFLPFLQLVGTSGSGAVISSLDANPYVLEHAALCAALLLSADTSDAHATSSMLAWVMTHIKNYGSANAKQVKVTEVAVNALRILLRHDFLRQLFVEEHGVERLIPMLSARNTQLLYETVFCLWSLSLTPAACPLLERLGAVASVSRLAHISMPLKVLRLSLGMLANVARQPECVESLADICETHVPETVDSLLAQEPRITDPELLDDLAFLRDAARTNRRKLTSMERYERDLTARKFEWTATHSADFWKEHAGAFEVDGFRLIEGLRDLLQDPDGVVDETTQAVALFDLGEFAVNHPQGRSILDAKGVRPVVMAMLKHDDEEVRQQALLACSKMLVVKWQFVSGNLPAGGAPAAAGAGAAKK